MARIFHKWPVSPTTEIIGMSIVGLVFTTVEGLYFPVRDNLKQVWNFPLPKEKFSQCTENVIRSTLSYIILVRSVTVHLYLLCYCLVIWTSFFEEKPMLLIPWLIVSGIKNIGTDLASLIIGSYICTKFGTFLPPVCLEFLLIKGSEMVLSVYLWKSVFKLFRELSCQTGEPTAEEEEKRQLELAARRRKCRSLANEISNQCVMAGKADLDSASNTSQDDDLMSESDYYGRNDNSRSLDSLFTQLHYDWEMIDSLTERRYEEEVDDPSVVLALADKATRFLRLSKAEIDEAKRKKKKEIIGTGRVEVGTQVNTLSRKFLRAQEQIVAKNNSHTGSTTKRLECEHAKRRMVPPSADIIENVTGSQRAALRHQAASPLRISQTQTAPTTSKPVGQMKTGKFTDGKGIMKEDVMNNLQKASVQSITPEIPGKASYKSLVKTIDKTSDLTYEPPAVQVYTVNVPTDTHFNSKNSAQNTLAVDPGNTENTG